MQSLQNKRMLITGGTGFIGSHLTRKLLDLNCEVHLLIKDREELRVLDDVIDKIGIHDYKGTTESVFAIMGEAKPEIVLHLASLFLAEHTPEDIENLILSNILLGTQLLEAMVNNTITKFINTGTSWQHYNNKDYSPACLYAATKQSFEAIIQYYVEATGLKTITLKLFDTYGKNDPRKKLFFLLNKIAETNDNLAMSPGEQLINLVYIDDVIKAFLMAAELLVNDKIEAHSQFAVSAPELITLKELVGVYEKIIGKKLPIAWGGRPYRSREVMKPWDRGELLPGWKPSISLEDGIRLVTNYKN